jgi:MFS transporter, Spinster family, sphingosine-1-phosphate transporter
MLSRRYAWYVLALLTALNFVNYVDRQMIVGMFDDFERVYGLNEPQFGALGTSFFVVHSLTTLPLAWLADRYDRRLVLGLAAIVWSLATLGTVWAGGFIALLFLRGLVGVGEAAYLPVSNALLAESFRADEKSKVVGIFNAGMLVGACVGIRWGVRLGIPRAFEVVAIPGIVLGIVALFLKITPHRVDRPGVLPTFGSMFRDARATLSTKTARWMLLAGIFISFTAGAYIYWFVKFIEIYQGLNRFEATGRLFWIVLTAGASGVVVGGVIADRIYRRIRNGRPLAIALGFVLAIPCAAGSLYTTGTAYYVFAWLTMFFLPWYNGPMAAVIDDIVDDDKAATAQGAFSTVLHLLGTAPGAIMIGFLIQPLGLREALLIPTGTILLAALCCLAGARHVVPDMAAKGRA